MALPSDRAFAASPSSPSVSPVPASIPSAGDWVVVRSWGLSIRQIDKVTPKLLKLGAGTARHPSQLGRASGEVVCVVPDRATARRVLSGLERIDGEYYNRRNAANADHKLRIEAAELVRGRALRALVASAIEARRAATLGAVRESAVGTAETPDV